MIRIHIICEGQTEEMFVNEVLSEVFCLKNIQAAINIGLDIIRRECKLFDSWFKSIEALRE